MLEKNKMTLLAGAGQAEKEKTNHVQCPFNM